MAIAKATSEALAQLSNTLLRSAEDILSAKAEMDRLSESILWDDPVGIKFMNSYTEGFKPLTDKLIPAIENYITCLENQSFIVMEYSTLDSNTVTGSAAAIGAGATLQGARYIVDFRPQNERNGLNGAVKVAQNQHKKELAAKERGDLRKYRKQQEERKRGEEEKQRAETGKQVIIRLNPDGTVVWSGSDENLSRGEEFDKALLKRAKKAMKGIDFTNGITVAQLRRVVDAVLGSENSEITFSRSSIDSDLEGRHDVGTRRAILNKDLEGNMSACKRMSIFTHEAAHVIQDDIYNYYKGIQEDQRTTDQIDFIKAYEKYPENVTYANSNTYRNNRMEMDARYYENIVGQACTEYYNEQLKLK